MKKLLFLFALLAFATTSRAQSIQLGPNGSQVTGILQTINGGLGVNASSITKNYVFAAPAAANGAPSFRKMVSADLPTNPTLSGTVTVSSLGTGIVSASSGILGAVNLAAGFVYYNSGSITSATLANFQTFLEAASNCSTSNLLYSPANGACVAAWPTGFSNNYGIPFYTASGSNWGGYYNNTTGNQIPFSYLPQDVVRYDQVSTWSALQTFGTYISIAGVTPTGATGTGNIVFSASPTFTGTLSAAAVSASGNITASGAVTGSTLVSTVSTGSAPLTVSSTTQVANLNASQVGGKSTTGSGTAIPTGPASSTSGDIVTFAGTSGQIQDSSKTFQGTDSKVLTSGTISGTGARLCTDSNAGATTVGCGSDYFFTAPMCAIPSGSNLNNCTFGISFSTYSIPTQADTSYQLICQPYNSSGTATLSITLSSLSTTGVTAIMEEIESDGQSSGTPSAMCHLHHN